MKKMLRQNIRALEMGEARFVFAYEQETRAALEKFQPNPDAEKLPEFKDVEKAVGAELAAKGREEQAKIEKSQNPAREYDTRQLNAIDQTTTEGKVAYSKLKKICDENEAKRKNDLKKALSEFNIASMAAYEALEAAYKVAKEKREKAGTELSNSLVNELMNARKQERDKNAVKDVDSYIAAELDANRRKSKPELSFQGKIAMPRYELNAKGIPNALEDHPTWTGDMARQATTEMLKAIYMEQGPEAAKAKADELKKACEGKEAGGNVNWFSWHKSFGGDEKGGFGYVLGQMCFDTRKGPELFGMVVGNMNAARELFKGSKGKEDVNAAIFARYEAAVQDAINQGKEIPPPGDWARKYANEIFVQPDNPEKFVNKILESYKMPAEPVDYAEYKKDPSRIKWWGTGMDKISAAYEAKVAKQANVRAMLMGVLAAAPDSSKWDGLAKQALTAMMGGKLEAAKMNEADPEKIKPVMEIYGNSSEILNDESRAYISGLIYGAEMSYAAKTVEYEVNGKKVKENFPDYYKKLVAATLKDGQALKSQLQDATIARLNGLIKEGITPTEKAAIEDKYRIAVLAVVKQVTTAKAVLEDYEKKNAPKAAPEAKPVVAGKKAPAVSGGAVSSTPASSRRKAPGGRPAVPPVDKNDSEPATVTPKKTARNLPIARNIPGKDEIEQPQRYKKTSKQPASAQNTVTVSPGTTGTKSTETAEQPTTAKIEIGAGPVDLVEYYQNLKKPGNVGNIKTILNIPQTAVKNDENLYRREVEKRLNRNDNTDRAALRQSLPEKGGYMDMAETGYRVTINKKQDGFVSVSVAKKPLNPDDNPRTVPSDSRLASSEKMSDES